MAPVIVREHPQFLIVDKPAGWLVHPTRPDGTFTLIDWLREQYPGEFLSLVSLWICAKPLDEIRNLFQEAANSHTLLLWEAPTPKGLHPVSIVEQAWDLADLNSDYQAVLNLTHEDTTPENIRKATFCWQKAVQDDPLLPRSLYPKSFRGFRATDQLEKMWSKFRLAGS